MATLRFRPPHLIASQSPAYSIALAKAGIPAHIAAPRITARTVRELVSHYAAWAQQHYQKYGRPTRTGPTVARAVKLLLEANLGEVPLDQFGPLMLMEYQRWLLTKSDRPLVRKTINQYVRTVVCMFSWAVSRELLPPTVVQALMTVPPLKRGRPLEPGMPAPREGKRVRPVPMSDLMATRARVAVIIRDMIDVQLMTAMRPAEICSMRLVDLHQTPGDECAYYTVRPEHNKVDHHEINRVVVLGPKTLEILAPYIARATKLRPERSYLFRPLDAVAAARADRHAARKTPLLCGNAPGTRRADHPMWSPGERYSVDSYRRAINRGCSRAGVTPWSPNQLRHNGASLIANSMSLDLAREQLGHTSLETTMIYVEPDRSRLIEWAKQHA